MNRKRTGIKIFLGICAAFGWWGMIYPQLTMTPDTYTIINEETVQELPEVVEWDFDSDVYRKILEADKSQVHFRSRLLKELRCAGANVD